VYAIRLFFTAVTFEPCTNVPEEERWETKAMEDWLWAEREVDAAMEVSQTEE
jgi:hypothetical protein